MDEKLEPGDVVALKSGGPLMTVLDNVDEENCVCGLVTPYVGYTMHTIPVVALARKPWFGHDSK